MGKDATQGLRPSVRSTSKPSKNLRPRPATNVIKATLRHSSLLGWRPWPLGRGRAASKNHFALSILFLLSWLFELSLHLRADLVVAHSSATTLLAAAGGGVGGSMASNLAFCLLKGWNFECKLVRRRHKTDAPMNILATDAFGLSTPEACCFRCSTQDQRWFVSPN